MTIHQSLAEKTGVDRDGRVRPGRWSWIIPVLAAVLVTLVFFGSLETEQPRKTAAGGTEKAEAARDSAVAPALDGVRDVPKVSAAIVEDLGTVLWSQIRTIGNVALFALVPGLLGLIYRKKFWPWFLSVFAVLFILNLLGFVYGIGSISKEFVEQRLHYAYWNYVALEVGLIALLLTFRLRRHVTREGQDGGRPKNIVVCLDGTWNHPGQTDWGYLAQTNVFKLFDSLKETEGANREPVNAARCKRYLDGKREKQVAFYYHGVGNKLENSVLGQSIGGAFGLGAEAIKERAYLDVAREYQHGDRIFIFGFSRGAALARLVAGALDKRGVPRSVWTLRLFGRQRPVKTSAEHVPVSIEVLGCWDTVGAFGISKDIFGIPFQRINLLKDLSVPVSVKRAYHLLALDEDRDAFEPTLMDADPTDPGRIVEVWFSGNHSNVGGGFATDGLSDHALDFMLQHVSSAWDFQTQTTTGDESWGLFLEPGCKFHPNPLGKLRVSGGAVYERRPRQVPLGATIHDSVFERVRHDRLDYAPDCLFTHNQHIDELRTKLNDEVEALNRTHSLNDEEAEEVKTWVDKRLTIRKWTKVLEELQGAGTRIQPQTDLANG